MPKRPTLQSAIDQPSPPLRRTTVNTSL